MTVWQVLGLAPDAERDAIRRAYAKKLRVTNPEDDPEGFKVLREAYEHALAQAEHRAMWAAYEDEAPEDEASGDLGSTIGNPVADDRWHAAPEHEANGTAEIATLLPTRDDDLTTLRARMAAFETGLRSPWRAPDAELEQLLQAVLSADAMGEIGVRDEVENWLAELIAATIPASDAILQQAITAFAWDNGPVRTLAAHLTLQRFDEWRMIAALNQPGHDYHDGWRSLTRAPGNAFLWRIDAFRPRLRRGVAALLGHFGEVSPGLHHSFNTAAVARWEAYFAQPRLTLGIVCQVPVIFAALLSVAYAFAGAIPPIPVIVLCALLAGAAPAVTLLVLWPWRQSWAARDHVPWQERGWITAYGVVLVLAGLLPGLWPLLLLPQALCIAVAAFLSRFDRRPDTSALGLAIIVWAVTAFMTLPIVEEMSPAQSSALGTAAVLFVYLRVWHRRQAGAVLDDLLGARREWWLLAIVLAATALGFGIAELHRRWESVVDFYPVASCLLAAALPLGVVAPGGGPPRWIARMVMIVAFLAAGIATLPPERQSGPRTATSVPIAEDTAGRALAAMEEAQPAFAGVRTGNPALYAELRGDLEKFYAGKATRAEAMAAFGRRVDAAYQARLPETSTDLLLEGQRVHLAVLRALRPRDSVACAEEGTKPYDPTLLTQAQQDRQTAQVYNVLANPPVPRTQQGDARPVSSNLLLTKVAALLDLDRATAAARLTGKGSPRERCDARIAMLSVLVDLPPDGVAAMLRRELRRQRAR